MKFRLVFFFLLCSCVAKAAEFENEFSYQNSGRNVHGILELRTAAFFPASRRFRMIYGRVMPTYQAEAAVSFFNRYDIWTNIDWLFKEGQCIGGDDKTRIRILNLSMGFRYVFHPHERIKPYLGIGPSYGFIRIEDEGDDPYMDHEIKRQAWGGLARAGVYFFLSKYVFLDIFVDYLYQPVRFKIGIVDVGGTKAGGGLGVKF